MREPVITIVRLDGLGEQNPRFRVGEGRWHLEREGLENFDGVPHEVSTQDYAQYDGAYLMSERSGTVDRTIAAAALGDVAELRAEAEAFFVPGHEYEVHVEAEGRRRYFTARQYAFSLPVDNRRRAQRLSWTCLALDPMLLDEDDKRFDLAEAERRRGFPFVSCVDRVAPEPEAARSSAPAHVAGFVVGVLSQEIVMENDGDAAAYPRFEISSTGSVERPSVSIVDSSGEVVLTFGVDVTMSAGDLLVVDFSTRPTTVELNGENCLNRVTSGSTLAVGIDIGTFRIRWSAESGDAALHIEPTIRERYVTI